MTAQVQLMHDESIPALLQRITELAASLGLGEYTVKGRPEADFVFADRAAWKTKVWFVHHESCIIICQTNVICLKSEHSEEESDEDTVTRSTIAGGLQWLAEQCAPR